MRYEEICEILQEELLSRAENSKTKDTRRIRKNNKIINLWKKIEKNLVL